MILHEKHLITKLHRLLLKRRTGMLNKGTIHAKKYFDFNKYRLIEVVDTREFAGLWDFDKNTIYISTHQSASETEKTFWHEYEHCIQYLTGLHQALTKELLEVMAENRSQVLPHTIRKVFKK